MDKRTSSQFIFYAIAAVIFLAAAFILKEIMRPVLVMAPDGGGPTATTTACHYDNPDKSYVKKEKNCIINFLCIRGRQSFSDECGCGCKTEANATSSVLNYNNKEYNFNFSYPKRDTLAGSVGYQYVTNNSLVRVDLPMDDFKGTNLGEASFIAGASKDKKVLSVCLRPAAEESATTSQAIINGTDMKAFKGVGVGAGNTYETESYRAIKNGICYEATLLLHSGNIYNYDPGTVKEFDHSQALNGLREILKTLTIN